MHNSSPRQFIILLLQCLAWIIAASFCDFRVSTVWPCVGHQWWIPAGYPTWSLLHPISCPGWPMSYKYVLETWTREFWKAKSAFSVGNEVATCSEPSGSRSCLCFIHFIYISYSTISPPFRVHMSLFIRHYTICFLYLYSMYSSRLPSVVCLTNH